ncbi:serine/threonine protein kinase, CMGC, CDC2/CDK subfamily [Marasmius crinis-equi]|uniref:Serine/threonine protein kinase, CMGC, CDC2/CDK subfamily n=1 Tax=Marasmius crinis-equi TaxID=585013 RepID=A0ABR3FKZ3_9AGAR
MPAFSPLSTSKRKASRSPDSRPSKRQVPTTPEEGEVDDGGPSHPSPHFSLPPKPVGFGVTDNKPKTKVAFPFKKKTQPEPAAHMNVLEAKSSGGRSSPGRGRVHERPGEGKRRSSRDSDVRDKRNETATVRVTTAGCVLVLVPVLLPQGSTGYHNVGVLHLTAHQEEMTDMTGIGEIETEIETTETEAMIIETAEVMTGIETEAGTMMTTGTTDRVLILLGAETTESTEETTIIVAGHLPETDTTIVTDQGLQDQDHQNKRLPPPQSPPTRAPETPPLPPSQQSSQPPPPLPLDGPPPPPPRTPPPVPPPDTRVAHLDKHKPPGLPERPKALYIPTTTKLPARPPAPRDTHSPPPLKHPAPTDTYKSSTGDHHKNTSKEAPPRIRVVRRRVSYHPIRKEEEKRFGHVLIGSGRQDDYEATTKLGEGTFGEVHKAVHKATGKAVALKRILMHNEKEGMPVTALREIKILKAMKHPCVIEILDMFIVRSNESDPMSVYMVFPYMDHDLAGLLENERVKLQPSHIKLYMKQLLEGTAYMHRNHILHRDMKAANLLISNTGSLRIADFGLARTYEFEASTRMKERKYTNCVVTRWYRPPELLMGARNYGGEVDIWGIGCVFGEMFNRRPILPGTSDIDQLEKIWQLCGTPNQHTWPNHDRLPGCEGITRWKQYTRRIQQAYEVISPDTCDLIDKLLTCNPQQRITAEQALDHDYFWTDPLPADPKTLPSYEASHEFDKRSQRELKHRQAAAQVQAQQPPPAMPQHPRMDHRHEPQHRAMAVPHYNANRPGVAPHPSVAPNGWQPPPNKMPPTQVNGWPQQTRPPLIHNGISHQPPPPPSHMQGGPGYYPPRPGPVPNGANFPPPPRGGYPNGPRNGPHRGPPNRNSGPPPSLPSAPGLPSRPMDPQGRAAGGPGPSHSHGNRTGGDYDRDATDSSSALNYD